MLLPDHEIERLCLTTDLIEPFDGQQLQPASYDLRLGNHLVKQSHREAEPFTKFTLWPFMIVLGSTDEIISVPVDLAAHLHGKSGLARRGLQVECAGHVDPGYYGVLILELVNMNRHPIVLEPGMMIAKVTFERLESPCRTPYSSNRNTHQDATIPGF